MRKQKWRELVPLPKGHKANKPESGDLNTHNLKQESGQFSIYNFVPEKFLFPNGN